MAPEPIDKPKTSREGISERARLKIQREIEKQERERLRQLREKRLTQAKLGIHYFNSHDYRQAVLSFLQYLRSLEGIKGVKEGNLHPSQFDRKEDLSELILISGVYWDLVKVYDRDKKSKEKYALFKKYLNQFVAFSKGMPFEPLSSESLRKYIRNDKPVHAKDFKMAYQAMTGSKCFVVSSLLDLVDRETLEFWRNWRDQVLSRSWGGRGVIWIYYRVGPFLAAVLNRSPRFLRSGVASLLDRKAAT